VHDCTLIFEGKFTEKGLVVFDEVSLDIWKRVCELVDRFMLR
jgi:hypothetical protein